MGEKCTSATAPLRANCYITHVLLELWHLTVEVGLESGLEAALGVTLDTGGLDVSFGNASGVVRVDGLEEKRKAGRYITLLSVGWPKA